MRLLLGGPWDVLQRDYVLMAQLSQQHQLPQSSPGICQVFESIANLLDSHFVASLEILRAAYDTVCSFPNGLYWDVVLVNDKNGFPQRVSVLSRNVTIPSDWHVTARHLPLRELRVHCEGRRAPGLL